MTLDRASGAIVWRRYTIAAPAVERHPDSLGHTQLGPACAGVWSSPVLDERRGSVYFTTGNNYSGISDENSDAVFSIDARTGSVKWRRQTFANDTFNNGCRGQRQPACPRKPGPDADFTAPPVLVRGTNGPDILVAGQKSGDAYGLNPDTGEVIWHTRISQDPNPFAGSIWYGMVVQDHRLVIPAITIGSMDSAAPMMILMAAENGLHALNAFTGASLWSVPVGRHCEKSVSCSGVRMAPIAIPGVVFAGSVDGYVRAFDVRSGKVLWTFNTAREFISANGTHVQGGLINGAGEIMVANGSVYVNSEDVEGRTTAMLAFSIQNDQVAQK